VAAFALACIVAIVGWAAASEYLRHSLQEACTRENRARLVGFAATRYAWDHGGAYPETLNVLLEQGYVTRPGVLLDSGESLPAGRPYSPGVLASAKEDGPYQPLPGVRFAGRSDVLVFYERAGWGGKYCYFDDGHVERLSQSVLRKRLASP
jgi:hypothetical protein